MDRGYLDFLRLRRLHTAGAFFATRLKTSTCYSVAQSRVVAAETGLRCDQTIRLNSDKGRRCYLYNGRMLVGCTGNTAAIPGEL
jgi:hypothetical protein